MLRDHAPQTLRVRFVLASSFSVALGWATVLGFFAMIEPDASAMPLRILTVVGLAGALVGAGQWVVLGKSFVRGTPWAAANALAACLTTMALLAGRTRVADDPLNPAASVVAFLLVLVGLLSGSLVIAAAFALMVRDRSAA